MCLLFVDSVTLTLLLVLGVIKVLPVRNAEGRGVRFPGTKHYEGVYGPFLLKLLVTVKIMCKKKSFSNVQ